MEEAIDHIAWLTLWYGAACKGLGLELCVYINRSTADSMDLRGTTLEAVSFEPATKAWLAA